MTLTPLWDPRDEVINRPWRISLESHCLVQQWMIQFAEHLGRHFLVKET